MGKIIPLIALAALIVLVVMASSGGIPLPEGVAVNTGDTPVGEGSLPSEALDSNDPDFSAEGGLNLNAIIGWDNRAPISKAEAAEIEALTQVKVDWAIEQNEYQAEILAVLQEYKIQAEIATTQDAQRVAAQQAASAIDRIVFDEANYQAVEGSNTEALIANNQTWIWGLRAVAVALSILFIGIARGTTSAYRLWAPMRAITANVDNVTRKRFTQQGSFHIGLPSIAESVKGLLGVGNPEDERLVILNEALPVPTDHPMVDAPLLDAATIEQGKVRIAAEIAQARPGKAAEVTTELAKNLGGVIGALEGGRQRKRQELLAASSEDKDEAVN